MRLEYRGLHKVTGGYKGYKRLTGVTKSYKGLQGVTGGDKGLQLVTKDCRNFFLTRTFPNTFSCIKIKVQEFSNF